MRFPSTLGDKRGLFMSGIRKKRGDWDAIQEGNDVIETLEELASVKKKLKQGKHTYLIMRTEHPRAYEKPLQDYVSNLYKSNLTSEDFYLSHQGLLCTCCSMH